MMRNLHSAILALIFFFAFLNISYAQINNTSSLNDVYMGNFGYWDYQSTGSMQSVEQDSINFFDYSAVYLSADSTLVNPNKRVLYFFSSNQGANWVSGNVANIQSSYPSLALQIDGKAIVCFYDSLNSRIRVYRNQSVGSLTFDSLPAPPGIAGTDPKILFYRNYLFLTVVSSGQISRNRFNFITNSWGTWTTIGFGVNSSVYQLAKGFDGKIAVCWIGDAPTNNVKYAESADSGATFQTPVTVFTTTTAGTDTIRGILTHRYGLLPGCPCNYVGR